jgi:hypothetical protein
MHSLSPRSIDRFTSSSSKGPPTPKVDILELQDHPAILPRPGRAAWRARLGGFGA